MKGRFVLRKEVILYIFECVRNNTFNNFGDDEGGGTPVPIPNTAVKPFVAEDTWN